jgi:hypothetical protein
MSDGRAAGQHLQDGQPVVESSEEDILQIGNENGGPHALKRCVNCLFIQFFV